MKRSLAIIGPKNSQNTLDLCSAAKELSHDCAIYSIGDISVNVAHFASHPFFFHDIYLFRGYNRSVEFARSLATILHADHKTVIDAILHTSTISNKLHESILLKKSGIPQPQTYYARTSDQWKFILENVPFPLIIKPINGQQGKGIHKCSSINEVLDIVTHDPTNFIAQQCLLIDGDIRILIVDNEILGAIKRYIVPGDFRSNASLGAHTESYDLSSDESSIALAAHKALGYDISGVDMVIVNGLSYILEVNHTPQWQAFKKTTNIFPEHHIINFALQKYEKENRI